MCLVLIRVGLSIFLGVLLGFLDKDLRFALLSEGLSTVRPQAAQQLSDAKRVVDLVFIDADHSEVEGVGA